MQAFANLKIARKLAIGFGLGSAIALIIGLVSLSRMANIAQTGAQTYVDEKMVGRVGKLRGDLLRYAVAQNSLLLAAGSQEKARFLADMETHQGEYLSDLDTMKQLAYTEQGKETARKLEAGWKAYVPVARRVVTLDQAGSIWKPEPFPADRVVNCGRTSNTRLKISTLSKRNRAKNSPYKHRPRLRLHAP